MGGKNSNLKNQNDSSDTLDEIPMDVNTINKTTLHSNKEYKKELTIKEVDKFESAFQSSSKSKSIDENVGFNNSDFNKNEKNKKSFLKKISEITKSVQERINLESNIKGYKKTSTESNYFDVSKSSSIQTNSSHDSSMDFNKDIVNIKKDIKKNIFSTESLKIVKNKEDGKNFINLRIKRQYCV